MRFSDPQGTAVWLALALVALAACGGTVAFAPPRTSAAQFTVSRADREPQSFELGSDEVVCRAEEEGALLRLTLVPEELQGSGLHMDIKPFGPGAFDARNRSAVDMGYSALYCDAPCVSFFWSPEREQALSDRSLSRCGAIVDAEQDGYLITFECFDMPGAVENTADIVGEVFCSWNAVHASAG